MSEVGPVNLDITSNARCLPVVRSAVERMAQMEGFSEADAHEITWAIDEALANVIKHGYGGQPNQPILVSLRAAHAADGRRGLEVAVRDKGRQVDPASIRGRDLDEVRPGGLGVHIIRTVMDEVEYSCPAEGGMLLRMVKYVKEDGDPNQTVRPPAAADEGGKT